MSTSSRRSEASEQPAGQHGPAEWFWDLLGVEGPWEGEREIRGQKFVIRDGIPRSVAVYSAAQAQTEEAFGFKWNKRETFESDQTLSWMRSWLTDRYGDPRELDSFAEGASPLVVDAGCGAGMSAIELFDGLLHRLKYVGVDISAAVDVAADRFAERDLPGAFLQADLAALPFAPSSIDVIFSEGVLHHTDSARDALGALVPLLKTGGLILFYVYRRKGPIREFTDDYIRAKLQEMTPDEAWKAVEPLTRLGVALGELGVTVDVPEPIDLLGIPAGPVDLQRLFYWHVAKAFYRPEISFDEMNHVNYDWYAPANATRQSPEEVRCWCGDFGLEIVRETVEEAGITIVARKTR